MRALMGSHLYALLRQGIYGAAYNRVHSMEPRCCRWLLMTHDRPLRYVPGHSGISLAYTGGAAGYSEYRPPSRSKEAGLIRYVRGNLTVVGRPGLKAPTCGCYPAIPQVYNSLFAPGVWRQIDRSYFIG